MKRSILLVGLITLVLSLVAAAPVLARDDNDGKGHGKRIVVSPKNMHGWAFFQETPNGSGMMEEGPENPPAGKGSANLIVDSTGGMALGKAAYQGVYLRDFDRLVYSTYRKQGLPPFAIALQFNIDRDLNDADESFQGRIVYEPYYTHVVQTGEWQTWNTQDDAVPGNWWFTRPPQSTPVVGCSIADPCTWSEVLMKFPNVGVHRTIGAVILKAGGGWVGGFDGNTDALTIGCNGRTILWDFEDSEKSKDDDNKDEKLCGKDHKGD
ncbi:MAG: hypothetical protein M3R12_01965 [Actinomycetota bacterium]|nr:hypothetical protein [Actinomycetota bacterium]